MSTCLLTTSFALLRAHDACAKRYRHLATALGGMRQYGRTRAIPISRILTLNGLDDALWALRAVPENQSAIRDRFARLLACDYAEHALPAWEAWAPTDRRPHETIAVARRYVVGEATDAELSAAWSAARSAARSAAESARSARSAAESAWSARSAAQSAADTAYDAAAADAADAAAHAAHAALSATGRAAGVAAEKAERVWQAERLRGYLVGELVAGTKV